MLVDEEKSIMSVLQMESGMKELLTDETRHTTRLLGGDGRVKGMD